MTTLTDRPHTALLVVDVQVGVVGGAPRRDEVVATIGSLVERARAESVPVVWVQHGAHTTEDLTAWGAPPPEQVIDHTDLSWGFQSGPGRTAETVAAREVAFA